uniref:Uncharacterized protein n=1 Tax=Oryza punctata TaxID=4537 RepID=A0A0E0MBP4_ORYPU
MESRTPRSSVARSTCNVPGLVLGFSKLCKITKICAAPEFADTKTEFGDYCGRYDQRLVITRLFEEIGALKSAYIKLQKAHIPYNPPKIAFADEIITSELDLVTALQSLCSWNGSVGSLINDRWSLVQELEAETRKKDSDIMLLRRELDAAVSSEMEAAMFRNNLDVRAFVSRGWAPEDVVLPGVRDDGEVGVGAAGGGGGAKAVLWAWKCQDVYARRGSEYAAEYMESVVATAAAGDRGRGDGVAFTVTAGMKVGETMVACRVFLCHHQQDDTSITDDKFR